MRKANCLRSANCRWLRRTKDRLESILLIMSQRVAPPIHHGHHSPPSLSTSSMNQSVILCHLPCSFSIQNYLINLWSWKYNRKASEKIKYWYFEAEPGELQSFDWGQISNRVGAFNSLLICDLTNKLALKYTMTSLIHRTIACVRWIESQARLNEVELAGNW